MQQEGDIGFVTHEVLIFEKKKRRVQHSARGPICIAVMSGSLVIPKSTMVG
jgi:hypothetical protein